MTFIKQTRRINSNLSAYLKYYFLKINFKDRLKNFKNDYPYLLSNDQKREINPFHPQREWFFYP